MLPFQNLIIIEKRGELPLYKQIMIRLIGLIREGTIQPGTFFPGTRQMADTLAVNRKTIIRAYEELILQQWLESVPQKGYRVIPELPVMRPRSFQPKSHFISTELNAKEGINNPLPIPEESFIKIADIVVNDGFPDARLAPFKEISKIYRDHGSSARLRQLMSLIDQGGISLLKETASVFLNETRGLNISKDEIVITRGAQMAIYITATLLLKPGDNVVVSNPNYIFADKVIRNTGSNIIRIPVDEEGIQIDELEQILKTTNIKLLYVVPHHHHPTTVTMSAQRRVKLLELIRQFDFWVIEDDYDYDFHYEKSPLLPLASADHGGKIIYIGSFTKLLAPSIRIGYLIAAPNIVKQAINLRKLIDLRGDAFMEYMLSQMIITGDLSRHITRSIKLYAQRCDFICDLLSQKLSHVVEFTRPQGGMAIWLKFKQQFPLDKVISDSAKLGLHLIGMSFRLEGDQNDNALRFGFASLSEKEMEDAVNILVRVTS